MERCVERVAVSTDYRTKQKASARSQTRFKMIEQRRKSYPIEYKMDKNPDWNVLRNIASFPVSLLQSFGVCVGGEGCNNVVVDLLLYSSSYMYDS